MNLIKRVLRIHTVLRWLPTVGVKSRPPSSPVSPHPPRSLLPTSFLNILQGPEVLVECALVPAGPPPLPGDVLLSHMP